MDNPTTLIKNFATNADELRSQVAFLEQDPTKSDVWKLRALLAGVRDNAEYARAGALGEYPSTVGYLGMFELAAGLRPSQYVLHANLIAERALYWAAKIEEDQKATEES